MAIALVQKAPNTTAPSEFNAASGSVTFGSTPTAGNLLTVAVTENASPAPGLFVQRVSDDKGNNNYIPAVARQISVAGAYIYYKENALTGASHQVTVTMHGTTFFSFGCAEWSGAPTGRSLGAAIEASGSSTTPATGNMSPEFAGVYLGVMTTNNVTLTTITSGQTELHQEPLNNNAVMGHEYQLTSGAAGLTWTTDPTSAWVAVGAVFMETAQTAVAYVKGAGRPRVAI